MLFNSLEFALFLPIVFALYWFVFTQWRFQNLLIVAASYVFYGWWDATFLILIALTTLFSYASGLLIERYEQQARTISAANIAVNIAILGVYKYYNFFADSFATLLQSFGIETDWATLHLVLPVGISFYTFQALSYSIDVYRKKLPACHDMVAFLAYISFFPQLVAGPIERSTNLLPQFAKPRTFHYAQAVDGCRQILWGLFKKMVVADRCADVVNDIWGSYADQSGYMLLLAAVLFTFQIYGDFSGYSDIAIGTARLFGFNLMRNFHFPYFSRDIAEFWRRWHISLTTWFRDYIYIPLGGSRCGKWKAMRNTLVIFLVSGLWHGANWTFVAWGAYHAFLFFPLLLIGKNRKYTNTVAEGRLFPSFMEFCQMIGTFILAAIGWVIFRAESIPQAWSYLSRICSPTLLQVVGNGTKQLLLIFILLIVEWFQRDKQHALQFGDQKIWRYLIVRWIIYLAIAALVVYYSPADPSEFIYFQF